MKRHHFILKSSCFLSSWRLKFASSKLRSGPFGLGLGIGIAIVFVLLWHFVNNFMIKVRQKSRANKAF